MEMTFLKVAFRIVIAVAIGSLVAFLFQAVLPPAVAVAFGTVVGVVELVGSLVTAQHGAGVGVRMMLRMGVVVLAWPLAAWALQAAGLHDRGVRVGLAAAAACALGMGAARHGTGHDDARMVAVVVAVALPVYTALAAVLSGDARAMIAACLACAVAPITALVAGVWPDGHHPKLIAASGVCVCAAMAVLAVRVVL